MVDGMWGNPNGPRCSTVARTTNQMANGVRISATRRIFPCRTRSRCAPTSAVVTPITPDWPRDRKAAA